jgi:hypothetical protein
MVNGVRQTEIQTAEQLVPEPSAFAIEMLIEHEKHTSPGIDQSPKELIKAGGRKIRSKNHKSFNSIWNEEDLPGEWKESSLYLFV